MTPDPLRSDMLMTTCTRNLRVLLPEVIGQVNKVFSAQLITKNGVKIANLHLQWKKTPTFLSHQNGQQNKGWFERKKQNEMINQKNEPFDFGKQNNIFSGLFILALYRAKDPKQGG